MVKIDWTFQVHGSTDAGGVIDPLSEGRIVLLIAELNINSTGTESLRSAFSSKCLVICAYWARRGLRNVMFVVKKPGSEGTDIIRESSDSLQGTRLFKACLVDC